MPETAYATLAPDPSSPPARSPKVSTIVNEVCHALGNTAPDPNGIYLVVTRNFPKGGGFCAWHSFGTCNGVSIPVVYLPNVTGVNVCDIVSDPANPFMNGEQSMANDAAHELSETITDPFISAWYDQSGGEVGDKCQTQFGSPLTLSDGTEWSLQEEWSRTTPTAVFSHCPDTKAVKLQIRTARRAPLSPGIGCDSRVASLTASCRARPGR